jgi:hypothetical protein
MAEKWRRNKRAAGSELRFWCGEKEKPLVKRAVVAVSLWGGKERNPWYN